MVLSRRERVIVIATLAIVGVAGLYWVALAPLLDRLAAVGKEKEKLAGLLQEADDLKAQGPRLREEWKKKVAEGMKGDWASADSQLLTDMNRWARTADTGVKLNLFTPVRSPEKGRLAQVAWEVTGAGTWRSIINLLWKIETAPIPIRLSELTVSAHRDGIDDLTAVLKVSTLYSPRPGAEAGGGPIAPAIVNPPAPSSGSTPPAATNVSSPAPPSGSLAAPASQPEPAASQPGGGSTSAPDVRPIPSSAPAETTGSASQPTTQGGF